MLRMLCFAMLSLLFCLCIILYMLLFSFLLVTVLLAHYSMVPHLYQPLAEGVTIFNNKIRQDKI